MVPALRPPRADLDHHGAELSASIIVYSGGRETMPIQIFKLIEGGLMARPRPMDWCWSR